MVNVNKVKHSEECQHSLKFFCDFIKCLLKLISDIIASCWLMLAKGFLSSKLLRLISKLLDLVVNTGFPVVFYEPLPHSAVDPATQYHVFMWAPIGIGTHSSIVSRTMTMCIYVLSPNLILVPDARHYYPLIINASRAIRVPLL